MNSRTLVAVWCSVEILFLNCCFILFLAMFLAFWFLIFLRLFGFESCLCLLVGERLCSGLGRVGGSLKIGLCLFGFWKLFPWPAALHVHRDGTKPIYIGDHTVLQVDENFLVQVRTCKNRVGKSCASCRKKEHKNFVS